MLIAFEGYEHFRPSEGFYQGRTLRRLRLIPLLIEFRCGMGVVLCRVVIGYHQALPNSETKHARRVLTVLALQHHLRNRQLEAISLERIPVFDVNKGIHQLVIIGD